jgi:hypothetical protein
LHPVIEVPHAETATAPDRPLLVSVNFAPLVSAAPRSTSITGHEYALARLLRALVRRLFLEHQDGILDTLRAHDDLDLVIPAAQAE